MNPSPRDGWAVLGQDATHVLEWIHAGAPWPLMAVALFWLARRHPAVYVRIAIALLLSTAAGLAVTVSMVGVPVRGAPLARDYLADYLALPGAWASWYLLLVPAVAAAVPAAWARLLATAIALASVTSAVVTAEQPGVGALLAVGVPVLAWFTAGPLAHGARARRRGAGLPSPSRDGVAEPWAAPDAVPLRRAG
ncbi:hypothetical protein [Streptomyces sp. NPDC026673]|uniref:hypothetical protein n=1 Tax=Streptomyces sp. NPDC026673 TaxID=3155724 RepID=UPI0033EB983D